jgi:hypothetical protein
MDTHRNLMIAVMTLTAIHTILSIYILVKQGKLSQEHIKAFLVVSIIVCLIISGLSYYCMNLKM